MSTLRKVLKMNVVLMIEKEDKRNPRFPSLLELVNVLLVSKHVI